MKTLSQYSRFEQGLYRALDRRKIDFQHQPDALPYILEKKYTPDFKIGSIYIEAKGYFPQVDRTKMKAVKKAFPNADIRMVFMNAHTRLNSKNPKSLSYAQWCDRNGFPWANGGIPNEWIQEAFTGRR